MISLQISNLINVDRKCKSGELVSINYTIYNSQKEIVDCTR